MTLLPKMLPKVCSSSAVVFALSLACSSSYAAVFDGSVFLSPDSTVLNIEEGTATFDLIMDFTDPTVGGGIDLTLNGPVSFGGFAPSSYFEGLDPVFTGFGTDNADNDFEIHFGDFAGLDGVNTLGTITVILDDIGLVDIGLSFNSLFGGFFSATTFDPQDVDLRGASLDVELVSAVPVPAAVWLFMSGLGLLGFGGVRKRAS